MIFKILGIDPGFANVGVAVACIENNALSLDSLDVITTKKNVFNDKHISIVEDNFRRAQEISKALWPIMSLVDVVVFESMSFPRNAAAASKLSTSLGIISAFIHVFKLPFIQIAPMELKRLVCGFTNASKSDIRESLRSYFSSSQVILDDFERKYPKSQHEHAYDSLGAVVAGFNSGVASLIRRDI